MLSPKAQPPSISHRTNFALGALAGWWSFCSIKAASTAPDTDMTQLPYMILLFAIVAAFFRLVIYIAGVSTPFDIFGRIATGRIVIPGFDKVFVTPITVVIAAIIGSIIIKHSGAWYAFADSAVIGLLWCILFGGGLTLRNWGLTGQFRVRPPFVLKSSRQMIRQV